MSTTIEQKADRPRPGPRREYHFPPFERRRFENGLELIVSPVPKLPLVTVAAVFDAGAVCDPAGREGTAQLVAKLLLEGTERSDGAELTEQFERLGASIDAHADWDAAGVTMTVLAEHLPAAFALLGEVIRTPGFRQREFERLRAERLAELLQLRAEPRGLADEMFARFLYTVESRFARFESGDEQSVQRIEREHLLGFYETRYVPGCTSIIVVGDIEPNRADAIARQALGDWSGAAAERAVAIDRPAQQGRAVHLVAKTDAPQSELRIGHVGIPRKHPDFFAVNVMNAVLGGLFNSRINLNLREAHGYTYGAFSSFEWRREAGPFLVHTAVRSDVTEAAAREIITEIDRMRAEAISVEELSLATSYLDGVFPIRFESTAAIAAALSVLALFQLPDDYYDTYRERVRQVSAQQVLEAARRHLHPEALQMVVVGDQAAVRGPLESMHFGPLNLYDVTGQRTA